MKSGLENYYFSFKKTRIEKNCQNFVAKEVLFTHNPKRTRDYFLTDTRFIMPEVPSKNHSLTGFRHSHFFVFFSLTFTLTNGFCFRFNKRYQIPWNIQKGRLFFVIEIRKKKNGSLHGYHISLLFAASFFFFFFVDRKNRESMRCFAAPPWNGGASRTKKRLSLKTFGSLFCFAIYIIISI